MTQNKQIRLIRIINILASHPEGVWLRQLAKETNTPPTSIHRYIEEDLKEITECLGAKDEKGHYFGLRIIRLKPKIQDIAARGEIDKIQRFLKNYRNI